MTFAMHFFKNELGRRAADYIKKMGLDWALQRIKK
jgi:hypothetical protein